MIRLHCALRPRWTSLCFAALLAAGCSSTTTVGGGAGGEDATDDALASDVTPIDDATSDSAADASDDPADDTGHDTTADPPPTDTTGDAGPDDTAPDGPPSPDATADADPGDAGTDPVSDAGDDHGLVAAPAPPAPAFDDVVEHITVTIATATSENAETDDGVRICLADGECWSLDTPDVNDRERGETEVYHRTGLSIPRSALDRMTIESTSGAEDNDRWTPSCIDVRFDGEPVYCNDAIPVHIGTGASRNEVRSWTDPAGLHEACTSCWGERLTHGPLLGPPTESSARLAVRTDATRRVGLRMGTTPDLTDSVVVAWAVPRPEDDFTADLVVDGLRPDTRYYWRVDVDGVPAGSGGEVQTAPVPGTPSRLRFAYGSCTRSIDQPIFDRVLARDPDLFLFVGDNHYANSRRLEALRWHYRRFRRVPERARLVAAVPTLATWDDHDFVENNSNGTCLGRATALQAFDEAWANPYSGTDAAPGAFYATSWGDVDLFVLDCRSYRPDVGDSGNRCDRDPDAPALPRSDGPLGPTQEAWFFDQLRASDATFKLVACGSRMSPEGSTDSWRSFPEALGRVTSVIEDDGVDGVVFLSGDIHRSLFATVPTVRYAIPELISSPLANSTGTCSDTALTRECYDGGNAWVELDIDTTLADPTLTARLLDDDGHERATWVIPASSLR